MVAGRLWFMWKSKRINRDRTCRCYCNLHMYWHSRILMWFWVVVENDFFLIRSWADWAVSRT
jgi:hypothetical protein